MGVKTIALDLEVYELLRRQKREGESFSDVVKRLARRRASISEFAGAWRGDISEEEIEKIRQAIQRGRELEKERMAGILERLE